MSDENTAHGCPWCRHAIEEHEERGGHRVCTRGVEIPSCRACAAIRDQLTEPSPLSFPGLMQCPPSVLPYPFVYGRPLRPRVQHAPVTVPDVL